MILVWHELHAEYFCKGVSEGALAWHALFKTVCLLPAAYSQNVLTVYHHRKSLSLTVFLP
jgi:hypothetical protein